ncbi:MAG: hypothetical protein BRC26_02580, partial [Nanohaloarchaea archaeon QH_8_44_6]
MEEVREKLEGLEKIEKDEEDELNAFLSDLAQTDKKDQVQEIYSEVETFISLNRRIVNLIEYMYDNPANFIDIYQQLSSLNKKHEELEEDILQRLQALGVSENVLSKFNQTDKRLRQLDEEIIREVKERRAERADEILEERPSIRFEAKALEKFLRTVQQEQLEKGVEVPGIFGYQMAGGDYYLNKFLKLENDNPGWARFSFKEQVEHVLEEYGDKRNVIIAHSHPPNDMTHSGPDKDILQMATNIGVIGVPMGDRIYPIPEKLDGSQWVKCPSKVADNGKILEEQELKNRFYAVWDYNQALRKGIKNGN